MAEATEAGVAEAGAPVVAADAVVVVVAVAELGAVAAVTKEEGKKRKAKLTSLAFSVLGWREA